MPRNISQDTLPKRLPNTLNDINKRLKATRIPQTGFKGYFTLPVRSSDPPVTGTGQFGLYYNSGTGKVRKSYNGGAWADTTI